MSDVSVSLDLDAHQMYRDLQTATGRFQRAAQQIEQSGNRAGAGTESILRGERRVVTGVRGLSSVMLSGGDAASYLAGGLEAVHRIFRIGLGASAGIIAIVVSIVKGVAAIGEMKKATTEARTELAKPMGASFDDLKRQIDDADKAIDKLRKSREGLGARLAINAESVFNIGQTPVADASLKAEQDLLEGILARSARIAELAKEEREANEVAANQSQRKGELLKSELATKQKLAEIDANKNLAPDARGELRRKAISEGELAANKINDKFDAQQRAIDEQRDVRFIKGYGEDVDVNLARSKKVAAERDRNAARTDEERQTAQEKVDAAQFELEEAQRVTAEKRAQQALAIAQADLTSEGDKRHEDALKLEEESLRARLQTARPDEARELNVDLAKNLQAQRDIVRARLEALHAAEDDAKVLELQEGHHEQIAELVKLQLDYAEKIRTAEKNNDPATAASLRRQSQLALASKADASARSNRERGQLSLEELAQSNLIGGKGGVNPAVAAREALREQELGRQAALRGDLAGSLEHQNRADQIKRGIDVLKDSEKNLGGEEFKNALDGSDVLKKIEENTADAGKNK